MRKRIRISGVAVREVFRVEPETERDALHQEMAERRHHRHVIEHCFTELGKAVRKEIRAMERQPGHHRGMVACELGTEINALLQIRLAGGELISHREVTPPGTAPAGHRNAHFRRKILLEKSAAQILQLILQGFVHAVIDDIKESAVAASPSDFGGDGLTFQGVAEQRSNINDRNFRCGVSRDQASPLARQYNPGNADSERDS